MHEIVVATLLAQEELQGAGRRVGRPLIHLASSYAVAQHLDHIARWHGFALYGPVSAANHIHPILHMVLVAALMMQPCRAKTAGSALVVVRTAMPAPITCAYCKLRGAALGKVMRYALRVKPDPKAQHTHQKLVAGDGLEVPPCLGAGYARIYVVKVVAHAKKDTSHDLHLRLNATRM